MNEAHHSTLIESIVNGRLSPYLFGFIGRDVLIIVFSQGLLSATLHQYIYASHHVEAIYEHLTRLESLRLWAAMAAGDIVGSMILMLSAVAFVGFLQRIRRQAF